MNRKIGYDNRLCYQREVARCQTIHQDRLRHMQPTSMSPAKGMLDNTAPQAHTHLKTNFKKAQMNLDKNKQIYAENQQLMRKMVKICDTIQSDAAVEFRPGMRLNIDQTPMLDSYVSVHSLTKGCAIDKGSMNGEFRQRQNDKIEDENRKMMSRLVSKKSCYSARKWDQEYKQSIEKFKHVRHDATVGYLSPRQKRTTPYKSRVGWDHSTDSTLPSLTTPRRDDDVTSIHPSPPSVHKLPDGHARASTAACTQRSSAFIRQSSKSQVTKRKQTYRTKCVPVLLLEATTSMGVVFTIEELQIVMVTPTATQLGDQGFLLRAKKDDKEGECMIPLKGLKDIAASLGANGISILAKLDCIAVIESSGNFPRVTQALNEADLKQILVKLVQSVRVSANSSEVGSALTISLDNIPNLPRDLQLLSNSAPPTIIDVFLRCEAPPRYVLRMKAVLHLCHVRVYELRRLLTFHCFNIRTHHTINFQFPEVDLLPHFQEIPLWTDIYGSLFKLAIKRIQI